MSPLEPPLLTASIPGCGGRIKVQPEDFEVEEIPAYEPSGSGDHLYLWIEKCDVAPEFFVRTIARKLGIHAGAIGTAGLKDRRAVTRQWVSAPKEAESKLSAIDGDGFRLLKVSRHNNKLKPGHSRGNKFSIVIRDADPRRREDVLRTVEMLRTSGMPNYYGPQRFGRDGSTLELGKECLAGRQGKRLRPFVFKFALSAVQSMLFNDYLGRRMTDGLHRTVLAGDVMMKRPFGGIFTVDDVTAEQARFDAREIVMGGPMYGSRMFATHGVAAEREAQILQDNGLSVESFSRFGKLMGGTRRHTLIYLEDLTLEEHPAGWKIGVSLPSGSYATVLLREIMKTNAEGEIEEAEEEE